MQLQKIERIETLLELVIMQLKLWEKKWLKWALPISLKTPRLYISYMLTCFVLLHKLLNSWEYERITNDVCHFLGIFLNPFTPSFLRRLARQTGTSCACTFMCILYIVCSLLGSRVFKCKIRHQILTEVCQLLIQFILLI